MAVEYYLKKIDALLSPGPGEPPSGFITAEDLRNAFAVVLLAIDETYVLRQEQEVVQTLLHLAGKIQEPTYLAVDDVRDLLYKWSATIESSTDAPAARTPSGLLGTVYGDALPTTVAKTADLVNSLIAALAGVGLVRDGRKDVVVLPPPAPTAATGLVAPVAPNHVFTFAPKYATLPTDLAALIGAANVGDTDLAAAHQAPFTPEQYLVLADGSRVTWNGSHWSVWVVAITGLASPQPGTSEWTYVPAHAQAPFDFAALQAHPVIGDAALSLLVGTVDEVNFVTDEFLTLRDASTAYFTASHSTTAAPSAWHVGVAP